MLDTRLVEYLTYLDRIFFSPIFPFKFILYAARFSRVHLEKNPNLEKIIDNFLSEIC